MRIRLSDCSVHCEIVGDGAPILFLHGFLLDGDLWRHAAHQVAGDGNWRAIIPDLRGHGRSDATPTTSVTQLAEDAVAVLDAIGEGQPAVVVGLSLGGIIGFELIRRHRNRVRAFVPVCARANSEDDAGVARWAGLIRLIEREGPRAAADAHVDRAFSPTVDSGVRNALYDAILRMSPTGIIAAARALANREDSILGLGQIDCPALVVAGAEDCLTPVECMREIAEAIPGSQFQVISGAGHIPPAEQPELFAATLRQFLDTLSRSAPQAVTASALR